MTTSRGGDYLDTASLDQLAHRLSTELGKQLYTEKLPSIGKSIGSQDETAPFTHGQAALSQAKQANNALTGLTMSNVQRISGSQLYFLQEDAVTHAASTAFSPSFDVTAIRRDFPILRQKIHGKPLIWLDNAATTQKPQQVIDAVTHFYMQENSNIHRGAHQLATQATDRYEGARTIVQRFLGAQSPQEIVFVRGATEAINLVAQTYGRAFLQAGDEIVLTTLEHHANIVPWQLLCQEKGTRLRVVPLNENGEVILQSYEQLLGPRTRLVAISQVSNALGTIVPVQQMIALAHQYGARVLVDGAQAVPHLPVNVQELDADFYVFSGHKLFGPTGIGVLYGKHGLLEEMPPWQGGGNMIKSVTFEQTTFNTAPQKFEAGTGHIAGAVGLGAAIEYLERIGFEAASHYEHQLTQYAMKALGALPAVRLIGTAPRKVGVLSFIAENRSAQEVAEFLDQEGIAVRAGHHCAQPTMRWFGIQEAVRPSLAFYNTVEEIDTLVGALEKCLHQQGKGNPSHQYGLSSPHL
jgi:cysteine desulfurase/selenocysteine lyase